MKQAQNVPILKFGAEIFNRQLTALLNEIEGVRAAQDIEHIHRMRVASRRLRSALPIFGPYLASKKFDTWQKTVREITRILGEARDTDVQIEHLTEFLSQVGSGQERTGIRRLILRLRQRRAQLQRKVNRGLKKFEQSKLAEQINKKTTDTLAIPEEVNLKDVELLRLGQKRILETLQAFLDYGPYVEQPECVKELHAMRIAAKHLRYTMEIFDPLYDEQLKPYLKAIRLTQESLGQIHDCDVWVAYLPQFEEEERQRTIEYFGNSRPFKRITPGLHLYLASRRADRETEFLKFNQQWQTWQAAGFWEKLPALLEDALKSSMSMEPETQVQTTERPLE